MPDNKYTGIYQLHVEDIEDIDHIGLHYRFVITLNNGMQLKHGINLVNYSLFCQI